MSEHEPSPVEGSARHAPARLRRVRHIFWAAVVLVLLVGGGAGVWIVSYPDRIGPPRAATAVVDIPKGTGVTGIRRILTAAGVIDDDIRFVLLAKWQGAAKKLQAGEYAFAPGLSPRAVLALLASGKIVQHAVTIPEGVTLSQIADIVGQGGWGSKDDFQRVISDQEFLRAFGVELGSAEGYLFPDTYFFAKGTNLRAIVGTMLRRMGQVLTEEGVSETGNRAGSASPDVVDQQQSPSAKSGIILTRHQILTLASIIEKETALAGERPLVSRVFLNRLRQGMKLQADPTVIYGLAKFGSPLTKGDLETPNPYNTYINRGLPIGPICNPGRGAIHAALHPSPEAYYYFVAQGDGTHYFSKNLAEHNEAVFRYRKKRLPKKE